MNIAFGVVGQNGVSNAHIMIFALKKEGKLMKQLIIARKDLNMSPGKLAAQVSHANLTIFAHNFLKNISYIGEL